LALKWRKRKKEKGDVVAEGKKEEMRAIGVGLVRTNEIGRGVDMEGGQLRFRLCQDLAILTTFRLIFQK
jgi:hypothetical protein